MHVTADPGLVIEMTRVRCGRVHHTTSGFAISSSTGRSCDFHGESTTTAQGNSRYRVAGIWYETCIAHRAVVLMALWPNLEVLDHSDGMERGEMGPGDDCRKRRLMAPSASASSTSQGVGGSSFRARMPALPDAILTEPLMPDGAAGLLGVQFTAFRRVRSPKAPGSDPI